MTKPSVAPGSRRTYDVLVDDIEAGLRSGRFKIGDQLPGERILAETYGISRASVREAMRLLDAMGVLRSSNRSGPKSGSVIVSEPSAGLSATLRLHIASSRLPVEEIVEARILLETWAARTAALHDDPAGIQRARELLEAMDAPDIDPETFHALDAEFHLALSAMGGNTVIETIMESLSGSIRGYLKDALDALGQWPMVLEQLRAHHHGIFDAVEAKDAERAAELLRSHIAWLYEQTADRVR